MVHSRNNEEVGLAHEVKSLENQPQFSQMTMGQQWVGKTEPKEAFKSTQNAFKTWPRNFFKVYLTEFSNDCLTSVTR